MSRESVLDLTFCTLDLAPKFIDQHLVNTGLDHSRIGFTIQAKNLELVVAPTLQPRFNIKKADQELFKETLALEIEELQDLLDSILNPRLQDSTSLIAGTMPSLADKLDLIGQKLTDAIAKAAEEAIPRIKQGPKLKLQWNNTLKDLRNTINRSSRNLKRELQRDPENCYPQKKQYLRDRNRYFLCIKAAKREHWNNFLEKEDLVSIFKAIAYTKDYKVERVP